MDSCPGVDILANARDPVAGRKIGLKAHSGRKIACHVMKKTLIPLVVEEKIEVEMKDYVTRTTRKEKLKFISWSSSVGNYRLKEEEASHLPIGMFDS